MSAWHIAGLVFIVPAAWYVQWVTRWAGGPFAVLEKLRKAVLGVAVGEADDKVRGFHYPTRGRFSAIGLLECAGCTLFWLVFPLFALWWVCPVVVIMWGVAGAAFLVDEWRSGL